MKPSCPYCGYPAIPVTGRYLHPWRPELAEKQFWACEPCGAWVGCHPPTRNKGRGEVNGWDPLGTLANRQLRAWRAEFHREFDVLWRGVTVYHVFTRGQAYSWLAREMGLPKEQCHIGMFNEEQCSRGLALVRHFKDVLTSRAMSGKRVELTLKLVYNYNH